IAQSFGYINKEVAIVLNSNLKMDFSLSEEVIEMEEIVITTEKKNENITQTHMGVEKIEMKEINKIPVLLGERDVLKSIQLIPGIKSAGEGNTGFYVRGGGADQNLILLDEAPVYNASHLLGFFSVFNSDAIKDVNVYKGGMPAEYGGRLSSVLDIKMNDGNNKKFGASGGIGLISSRLNVEGPIVKEKGSFTVYGRRSYADLFLKLSPDSALRDSRLYFYDLNAKANYRINDNNRIFISGYFGRDVLGFRKLFGFDWGNATGTIRWNHSFSDKLFSNTSLIFSNYSYKIKINFNDNDIFITSKIRDYNFKQDFQYYANPRSTVKFGYNTIFHKVVPGEISISTASSDTEKNLNHRYAWENAAYISHDHKLSEKVSLVYGIRLSAFSVLGPGDFFTINSNGEITDTTTYRSGEFIKTYINPEPRFAANYIINESNSVKASYARTTQNLHLLSNSTSGSPTDLWLPSSNYVKPEIADQVSLGYFRNFKENMYQFSTEVYYKNLQNQIDFKDGAELNFNESVETELLIGKGRAYGIEFFFKKKYGKFNGWIGYTLSRTERKFDQINNGKYFPAKQDRTHDISIVGIYELTPKWSLSATWVYYTGNAVTFPSGKYQINGQVVNYYTERNGYRMPAYHRMDLGANWQVKKTEKFESSWTFSIYNVYARANAYTITFRPSKDDPTRTEAVQTTLFKLVPSFTYNFKF
ncbi:MAG: TonB-dependent receptor, partial [Cytophagaceae bacterium]|nr:TonB-dependent receptor [Cytophagaceae bacterium]